MLSPASITRHQEKPPDCCPGETAGGVSLTTRNSIRVLHLHGRMGRGGAEVRTLDLFQGLDRREWQFDFCALSGLPGELDAAIEALGGRVYLMREGRPGFPRRFRELLERGAYDVVHSHLGLWSGYVLRLAAECGVPGRVAHFRSTGYERCGSGARRLVRRLLSPWVPRFGGQLVMRRLTNRYATHLLGCSEAALDLAWGPDWRSDPRCHVVYDGFSLGEEMGTGISPDGISRRLSPIGSEPVPISSRAHRAAVRQEFGLSQDAPLCIHVGRITEPKNHLRLAAIFRQLLRRRPDARLLLVGRTDDAAIARRLAHRIAKLDLADRVVLAGDRRDVHRLMAAADALVFPSLWEGLGGVVVEAAGLGLPVVASDLPAIREIAAQLPGVHLLPLAADDDRWAARIDVLLAGGISAAGRAAARQAFRQSPFALDQCARAMRRLWQEAAARETLG